jgi:hypothetical protein
MMSQGISNYFVRNKLTNKMISKYILSPISFQNEPPPDLVHALGINDIVGDISNIFEQYKKHDDDKPNIPRYMPFYRFINEKIPDFEWQIRKGFSQPISVLNKPNFCNGRPSLLNLIIAAITDEQHIFPDLMIKHDCLKVLPNDLVFDLEKLIIDCGFSSPKSIYWESISQALLRGLNGEKITLISPVCPDYSYETINGQSRYTFNGIGDGLGLVATRVVKTLPKVRDLLVKNGIDVEVVVAAGDFEALDSDSLIRLNETTESFSHKLKNSQQKIIKAIASGCSSIYFIDSKDEIESWNKSIKVVKNLLSNGCYGCMSELEIDFSKLLNKRLPLYRAWHPQKNNKEFMDMLFLQGAEYALMGKKFSESFTNPLVIGADHVGMMPFYWFFNKVPVFYLKRGY